MQFELRPLGEFVSLLSGNTPSKSNPSYWGGTIPWVSAKDMGDFWIEDSEDHLTESGSRVASRLVPPGTVLLLTRGMTLHKRVPICRISRASTFNQDVKAVLPKDGLLARFLPYLLAGNHAKLHERVDSAGHGTGRLNTDSLLSVPVYVPTIAEQSEIADLCEAIDGRLRLLRQTNATLESIAQALFKSWFIDFDPVRAKVEGSEPEGIGADTAALFPDSFEESILGEIPRGWVVGNLSTICESIFSGGTPDTRKPEYWIGSLPWFSSGETRERVIVDAEKRINEFAVQNSSTRLALPGDILIASAGQGHTRGQTSYCAIETYINQSVVSVRADRMKSHSAWVFCNLSRRYDEMRGLSDSHSSRGSLTTKLLASMRLIMPPVELMNVFGEIAAPLLEAQARNRRIAATLGNLRDTLLPYLISGKLRLPEAEAQLSEALA